MLEAEPTVCCKFSVIAGVLSPLLGFFFCLSPPLNLQPCDKLALHPSCFSVKMLAERLHKNATLTSLDLSSNPLTSEGASYIAQVRSRSRSETLVATSVSGSTHTTNAQVLLEGNNECWHCSA